MQMPIMSNAKALYVGACLFFVALIGIALYQFFNTQQAKAIAPLVSSQSSDALVNGQFLDKISPHHVFGQKPTLNLNVSDNDEQNRSVSRLNIQITGILASNAETLSQVTLKVQGQKEKNYRIGDAVQGDDNIVLTAISANDISINNSGVIQSYALIRPPLKSNKLAAQEVVKDAESTDELTDAVENRADDNISISPSLDEMMRAEDSELEQDDYGNDSSGNVSNGIYQTTDPDELELIAEGDGNLPDMNETSQQDEAINNTTSERVSVDE